MPLIYHEVICISAVISDESKIFQRVHSIYGATEKELLARFLDFINRENPKLISFNGRGFDLPMLMLRAMKYNLSCPAYFEVENIKLNKNKWNNYRARFSHNFHIDLLDSLSEFGSIRGLKLHDLCLMNGLPGKFDISGERIMELYYQGHIDIIKNYCESDTINTYWLFLKYEILTGNILKDKYIEALLSMRNKLSQDKSYILHFIESIDKELTTL